MTYIPKVSANQLEDVKKQKDQVKDQIQEKSKENQKLEEEATNIRNQMKELDEKITETMKKATEKEKEVDKTKKEVEELKSQITELEKRIEERDALLKERMKDIQTSGGVLQYADVLLGSENFSDFVNKASLLGQIVNQDKEIIETQTKEKNLVEDKKVKVSENLVAIEKDLKSLQSLNNELDAQKEEKNKFVASLTEEQKKIQKEIDNLEREVAVFEAQEKEIKEQIRQAEEAARKATEAKAAQEAQAQATQEKQSSGGSGISIGQASKVQAAEPKQAPSISAPTSSGFIRPAAGTFTSGFGPRWGTNHNGIDIAAATGTPIVAAASGTVVASTFGSPGNYNRYGNVIVIRHNINGKTIDTLYAHLNSRSVSVGQTVSQGQTIGAMGSTGDSTGPHLHFEIHPGGYDGKHSAVNPANYGIR